MLILYDTNLTINAKADQPRLIIMSFPRNYLGRWTEEWALLNAKAAGTIIK